MSSPDDSSPSRLFQWSAALCLGLSAYGTAAGRLPAATAAGFTLVCVALLTGLPPRTKRLVRAVIGGVFTASALARLVSLVTPWPLADRVAAVLPGDSLAVAFLELFTGLSFLSLLLPRRAWFNLSVWIGANVITLALLMLLNNLTGYAGRLGSYAAVTWLALGVALTSKRLGHGFLRAIGRQSPVGLMGRRLLVVVLLLPVMLHFAQLLILPVLDEPRHDQLLFSTFFFVLALVWLLTFSLRRLDALEVAKQASDAERERLLAQVQDSAAQLQQQVASRTHELATALEQSLRFDHLARTTTNGVVITDSDGRITWANATWEKITGYALAEVQGQAPAQLMQGPETDQAVRARLQQAMAEGRPVKVENIYYRKDRKPIWIELEVQPVRAPQGVVTSHISIQNDITERKRHVAELRQLNERLSLAVRALDCGMWDYQVELDEVRWSARQCEIYGVDPVRFGGRHADFIACVHPDDRAHVEAETARAAATGDLIEYDFRIVRPDGAVRYLTAHSTVQRDQAGRVVRLVGIDRDITAAVEMREQLRIAEERWHLALQGSNDGVWDVDLVRGRAFYDQRWAEMVGSTAEAIARESDAWASRLHPDDRPVALAALQAHIDGRSPSYSCEFRLRHADGRWIWFHGRGRVVSRDAGGRALRVTGTQTDISTRKGLEEQLRQSEALSLQLGRLAQIGAWELDLSTQELAWAPEIYRIHEVELGYRPGYAQWLEFYPHPARQTLQDAIESAAIEGKSFDLELPFVTARGHNLWVRVQGRTDGPTGRGARVYGAFQDITARRDAEDMRRQLEGQLFQAQKMETLGTLAGGIAHDFNNLLTGILGYEDLALDSLEPEHPARMYLSAARDASMRARELVDQILTFSRQAGSEKVPVNLTHVIEDAHRFLRATVPATVRIEVAVAEGCEQVLADVTQIHQVLLNLGSNAAHAMRATGGLMRITLEPVAVDYDPDSPLGQMPPGRYLKLRFSDTGHGMSAETLKRIFDPFFTTKDVGQGTGLGLSVVHGIIQAHQGSITVESEPDVGTTFTIHLPVAAVAQVNARDGDGAVPRGGGELIAIVDDEDILLSFAQMALERNGYKVRTYSEPQTCLDDIRKAPDDFAVLLTDQTMPGMRGLELAEHIRHATATLPIVIMSGYFSRVAPDTFSKLGRVDLLSKPFTNEELARAIHRAIHQG